MSSVDITALRVKVESIGIKEASNALGGLSTSAANTTKRIEALTLALSRLQTVNQASNAALAAHLLKMQRQATLMQTLAGSTAGAAASATALAAAMALLAASLNALNQRSGNADRTQRRHNESMREAHALARGLSGSLGALWLTYGNFAGMAVGLAIGASLKGIITVGKDVEHTLEGIRIKGSETIESIDKIRDSIFNLGRGVYGPQQVALAFETLILAGLKAEQALVSVNAAMNLAVVGGTTIERAAMTLVSVGTAVGYSAEGFDRVGDVIAKTAALSMSSVTTLSEAFKSGSSVNRLYGVSLEDIGTNLGVLSNLGIQGSAAGTAMKNFYKELAAPSSKVNDTFKSMKMTAADLKDSKGNFLPLLEVVDKLAAGLNNLTEAEQKLALANITNERGLRLATQLLGEWNVKTAEGSNALKDFRKNVENSYGFAAIGAVAMALTAKSQIDSMVNNLKTSFAEVFTEMQPEIIAFTGRMKEIFNSGEFKDGLRFLAQSFANLAVAIADNLPLITKLIIGFTAVKLIIAGAAIWTSAVAGITAISVALKAATTGTLTFTAALGPLAIVLGVATAALILYNNAQEDGNKHMGMAQDYSRGYLTGLTEEAIRLDKVNKQLDKKLTLSEANAAVTRGEARDKMILLNNNAIEEARLKVTGGPKNTGFSKVAIENEKELARLRAKAISDLKAVNEQEALIVARAKEVDLKVKANAKTNRGEDDGEGTGTLDKGPKQSAINQAYMAIMLEKDAKIKAAKKEMRDFEEQQLLDFKSGEIGKLQFLEEVGKKELEVYGRVKDALQSKFNSASNPADRTRFEGELTQADEDYAASRITNAKEVGLQLAKYAEDQTRFSIQQMEIEGDFAKAAKERFRLDHGTAYKQAQADLEKYGDQYPVLGERVAAFAALSGAAIKEALNKEAVDDFNVLAEATRNALRGVQTATEGQGLATMFMAASEASETLATNMVDLKEKMGGITDPKALNEAQAQLTNLAETQRKLWVGVADSISNSLGSAFGSAGKAAGELLKITVDYSNLEKKSGQARIKSFGDAAGAAKGFFKEGTTGYKVMAAAEKAFTLIQIAEAMSVFAIKSGLLASMTTAKIAADAAAKASEGSFTVFSVAQSMIRAAWKGIEAVLNQGNGDPYTAFARMAAMAAVVVGLGVAIGGIGGGSSAPESAESRQKRAGTGGIFGMADDTKSESIRNSLEILEKNSGLGLAHSNGMLKSLRNIENALVGFTNIVIRSGVNGLTAERVAGSVESAHSPFTAGGSLGKFSLGETITKGFASKIASKILGSIFGGAVTNLDTGITAAAKSLGSINMSGITAQQYTESKKEGGWFRSDKYYDDRTNLSGEVNRQFAGVIKNLGQGVTAAADALGIGGAAFNARLASFVVDIGKISLKGLTGEEIQKQFEAIFSKLGDDMARFGIAGLEKFQQVGEGYFETLARVANNLIQVRDVFAVLNHSFTLTGIAAVEVSESLIAAAGSIEILTEGTKFFVDNFLTEAERMAPITASVNKRLQELNLSNLTTVELYKAKVLALDLTNAADQEMYAALLELAPAFMAASEYAQDLADGTVSLTRAQKKALEAVDKARDDLQRAYDKESDALQNTIDKTKAYAETLKNFQDSLKLGANSPLTNMEKYAEARRQFDATALAAQNGDAAAQGKIVSIANEFLNASKVINASGAGYTADYNTVMSMTTDLANAALVQVDTATASLAALNLQVAGLLKLDESVLTVTQAIVNLQAAIVMGRAAGLSNTSMGLPEPTVTTTTPTSTSGNTGVVPPQIIEAINNQTGVLAGAIVMAGERNSEAIVGGFSSEYKKNNRPTVSIL